MPLETFVIQLADGQYFAGCLGGYPVGTADINGAKTFPSRLGALGATAAGPASFFDHAAIVRYSPQDAPAGPDGHSPSLET